MNIHETLINLRKERGIKQKVVADFIHKSQQAYSKYEKGIAEPDLETIGKIAEFYNISINAIINNEAETLQPIEDNTITIYGRGYGMKKYKLSPKKLKAIRALLDDDDESDDIDF